MHWLKLAHFAALLTWCGTLLYLPALIAAGTRRSEPAFYRDHAHILRLVFTLVASPAALLAIVSGVLLFLETSVLRPWLILKLSLVSLMVILHTLCGVLILGIEDRPEGRIRSLSGLLALLLIAVIGATFWLALAKPL